MLISASIILFVESSYNDPRTVAGDVTAFCGITNPAVGVALHAFIGPAVYTSTAPAFMPLVTLTVAFATGASAIQLLPLHVTT